MPSFSNEAERISCSPVGMSSVPTISCSSAADEAVHVVEPVVLHVEGVAAEARAHGEEHALGTGRGDVDDGADHERPVAGVDRLPLGDRRGARVVHVAAPRRRELGPRGGEDLHRRTVVEREGPVGPGLGEPDVDQLAELVGLLGGEVVQLGTVDVGVVELPLVLVEVAPAGDASRAWSRPSSRRARWSGSRASSRTASCVPDAGVASSMLARMLTPSMGLWVWPLIVSGASTPSTSRSVGTMSIAW